MLSLHDFNYFVIPDLDKKMVYYCSCCIFYEKVLLPVDERLISVYVPKALAVVSKCACYQAQRSFLMQMLKIQKVRLRFLEEQSKVIETKIENKVYSIEESRLYDFYIRTALGECKVYESVCEVQLKFSSSEVWIDYFVANSTLEC